MRGRPRQDADVAARMSALAAALTSGGDQLDADAVDRARDILERTGQRLQLGAGHTVVALVGATGSGKSSLFNALAGMEIAEVGARRPMTRVPTACIWGEGNTDPLLDWLEVPEHRRVRRESVLDADRQAPLHGLVLLDLPDHDSTEVAHRLEVDRLVELVDLLIWVVDPQKYADDALHAGYLQRLVGHDGVMMVVLNQIDRLGPDEADTCRRDLRRLLDGDGLDSVRVLAVSAWRGDGVDELRSLLATSVQKRTAVMERAAADLQAAADDLAKGLASGEPGPGQVPGTEELVRELASAVGVPAVVEAVAAEYRRRGSARTEWPVLRWLRALNPDALGRLGITVAEDDLRMIATSLMPAAAPSQRPHVRLAVDMFLGRVVDPLPLPWATAVRTAVTAPGDDLVGAVDSAVSRVDLGLSAPGWWRGVGLMHIAFGLALLAGSGWLFLIGAVQLAGRLPPEVPAAMGVPLPVLLFLGGLGAGAVTAAISAWLVSVGARRRAAAAANRLYAAVHGIAEARIITRVQAVLDRHRVTREALAAVDLPPPTPALSGTSTQEFAIPGGQFGRDGAQDDGNGSGEPGEGVQDGASPAVRQDAARDEAPAIAPSS